MAEAKSDKSWIGPFLRPLRKVFTEMLMMSVFINLIALVVPVFTLQVYDRVIFSSGISTLWGLVIGVAIVIMFDYIIRHSRSRVMQRVALRLDVEIGRKLFDKITSLPLQFLESRPSGYWQSLFRDVDMIRNTLSGPPAILLADLPFTIIFFALIFVIAKPLVPVLGVIWVLYMVIAWRSSAIMTTASREERGSTQSRDSLVGEMINGRTTIKALGLERAMRPMWIDAHAENIEHSSSRGSKTDVFSNVGGILSMVTTVGLTTVGAISIINQELTMGALIATNMLSGRLLGPLNQLVSTWRVYSSFGQAVERLGEVFSMESDRMEEEIKIDRPTGEVVIEDVVFSYTDDGPNVVDGVKIGIRPGGLHAIVGRNGCGKTTLIKMMQGLYRPKSGRVLLDGADIAQFSRNQLVNWIGYVPQETVLFAGSVRDNIVFGNPDATDDQIIHAAEAAGVHRFIIDLPDGYGTEIGEAGQRLSGGQRQRISIARALVGNPAVLLLDEPSGSLDRQAEEELRTTLKDLAKDHTVILVTHSPVLLQGCDNLIALDKGKIALAGPAKDILPRLFGSSKQQAPSSPEQPKPGAAAPAGPASAAPASPAASLAPAAPAAPTIAPKEKQGGGA
ncbi:MAG: ATP-binding cassette domain-containing protein [Rhodospirillales bacterium]|nr:ATP-binding cassette domain-containing protein [Rhodospirillales bacterium]